VGSSWGPALCASGELDQRGYIPAPATGLDGFAETLRDELAQELAQGFAGHPPPGQRVVVTLRGILMGNYFGSARDLRGGGNSDYLDGVASLIGSRGEILKTEPILVVSPVSSGGAWYLPGGEQRRAGALVKLFDGLVGALSWPVTQPGNSRP
jgi:hypothetical protein